MKRLIPLILAVPLLLAGCSENGDTAAPSPTPASIAPENNETPTVELKDLAEGVEGKVGFRHGLDCEAIDECSLNFTLESLEALDECDDYIMSHTEGHPEGTHLVKVTVLVETTDLGTGYAAGEFPIWADWSALDTSGANVPLERSSWCYNNATQQWKEQIHLGDTERRVHYMDVPDGATKIRLTETLTSARWEFPAPEAAEEQPATKQASTTPAPVAEAPAPQPTAPAAPPAPVQEPVIAPVPAPVIGFTGAPSVETPRVMDKQIASCGDPSIHQTGTTFFTDGTSGWTTTCSEQM